MLHQRFGVIIESLREMQLPLQDILINNERVVISKRINSGDHLVKQHPKSPPVDWLAMSLVLEDLRGKIFRGSAEREGPIFDDFGKSKISEFEITV